MVEKAMEETNWIRKGQEKKIKDVERRWTDQEWQYKRKRKIKN